MKIKIFTYSSALIFCWFCQASFSSNIREPLEHFYSDELRQEDEILTYRVDLNEDGIDEVFISTDSDNRSNRKAGRIWSLYISHNDGYLLAGDNGSVTPVFNPTADIVRLGDARLALLNYQPSSARSGALVAYYLDANNVLRSKEVEDFSFFEGQFQEKYQEVLRGSSIEAVDAKAVAAAAHIGDVYSAEKVSALKSRKADFQSLYRYGQPDPDDPRNFPVYRKSDGALVGYEKFGVFSPVDHEDEGDYDSSVPSDEEPMKQSGKVETPGSPVDKKREPIPERWWQGRHGVYLLAGTLVVLLLLLGGVLVVRRK